MIERLWALLNDPTVQLGLACGGIVVAFGLIDVFLVGKDDDH